MMEDNLHKTMHTCTCIIVLVVVGVGGVCRVAAFGNIELREGDFESRLVNGGDRCQVYSCVVREKHNIISTKL